ncbi:MAG: tetratricopeptide repeat protein [Promethearchaeota archaeon]
MVATIENFEKSKELFKQGDVSSTLDIIEKTIDQLDRNNTAQRKELEEFLHRILKYCRDNNLKSEEAMVLRNLGRLHSKYRNHAEGLKYSYQALKIQKKIGRKLDVAEGLVFLAEDLEISGNYEECIKSFQEAADIYHELGKLRKEKEIRREIERLKEFSKKMVEDEYYLNKFHIDKY